MTACEFCHHSIQQHEEICPQCCAIVPKDICPPSPSRSQHIPQNLSKIFDIVTPIITTTILKAYDGPAWAYSLLIGIGNITYLNFCSQTHKTNQRNFYHVAKLFDSEIITDFFKHRDDFIFCKTAVKKLSFSLSAQEKRLKNFSDVLDNTMFRHRLKNVLHIKPHTHDLPAIFELIKTQNEPIAIYINAEFQDTSDAFENVIFSSNIEQLEIQNSNADTFHESLWLVKRQIYFKHLPNLNHLPEITHTIQIFETLNIKFNHCALKYLPKTIAQRSFDSIDLSNCKNLASLPTTFQNAFNKGQIKTIDLTETNLPLKCQAKFTHKELHLPEETFAIQTVEKENKKSQTQSCYSPSLLVPMSLAFLTLTKIIHPRKKNLITENSFFWIALFLVAWSGKLLKACYRNTSAPPLHAQKDNVDTVWNIIQKIGIEEIEPQLHLNWTKIWTDVFKQQNPKDNLAPTETKTFIKNWLEAREKITENEFTQFIQDNGGIKWARTISNLSFDKMVQLIFTKAYNFPNIQRMICNMQNSIQEKIFLDLEKILSGKDCNISFGFESLFSLIKTKKAVHLMLNWTYKNVPQVLNLEPCPNIHILCIKNAFIHNMSEYYWHISHKLSLECCHGIKQLPDIPAYMPISAPLSLELINLDIKKLPYGIQNRHFKELVITKCPNLYVLPQELKEQISNGIVETIQIRESGIKTIKNEYKKDTSLTQECVFQNHADQKNKRTKQDHPAFVVLDRVKWSIINWSVVFALDNFISPKLLNKDDSIATSGAIPSK
ncbi:MAG: hypothetical protein H6850_03315 [Alphaproteobacteria bacterium]|nr:MAG: hypothetical protein H6850_03315 [Alphaproteobacteria bacterium]